jgi:hypothetical protein
VELYLAIHKRCDGFGESVRDTPKLASIWCIDTDQSIHILFCGCQTSINVILLLLDNVWSMLRSRCLF